VAGFYLNLAIVVIRTGKDLKHPSTTMVIVAALSWAAQTRVSSFDVRLVVQNDVQQ